MPEPNDVISAARRVQRVYIPSRRPSDTPTPPEPEPDARAARRRAAPTRADRQTDGMRSLNAPEMAIDPRMLSEPASVPPDPKRDEMWETPRPRPRDMPEPTLPSHRAKLQSYRI